jgi:hypothetical protein
MDVRRSGAWEVRRRTIVLDANVLLARTSASAELGGGSSHSGMLTVKTFLRYEGRTREPLNLKAEILGMRGVIHHLDLTVKDPEQVFGFYDAVLSAPGYRLERKSERGFDWNLQSPLGVHSIGLVKANSQGGAAAA